MKLIKWIPLVIGLLMITVLFNETANDLFIHLFGLAHQPIKG